MKGEIRVHRAHRPEGEVAFTLVVNGQGEAESATNIDGIQVHAMLRLASSQIGVINAFGHVRFTSGENQSDFKIGEKLMVSFSRTLGNFRFDRLDLVTNLIVSV